MIYFKRRRTVEPACGRRIVAGGSQGEGAMPAIRGLAAGLVLGAALLCAGAASADCSRACLVGAMDRYLQAMVAHDPARLPTTADVRFTEDGAPLKLGDGLWATNGGLGPCR